MATPRPTEGSRGSLDRRPRRSGTRPQPLTTIVVNGTDVALCRGDQDDYYALSNRCPHRLGQIGDGAVENGRVICPLHGWDFDLRTGISPYDPSDRLATYPCRHHEGRLQIDAEAVPVTPTSGFLDEYQGRWRRFVDDVEPDYDAIQHFARYGSSAVEAMRTTRPVPSFNALQFRPAQLAHLPLLDDEPVSLAVELGGRSAQPLRLEMPILISHMSFGAISREAKIALARASRDAGLAICSGEGGMLPEERQHAQRYIFEMASGYFGWTEENIKRADAIEIKIGQAAKAGAAASSPATRSPRRSPPCAASSPARPPTPPPTSRTSTVPTTWPTACGRSAPSPAASPWASSSPPPSWKKTWKPP